MFGELTQLSAVNGGAEQCARTCQPAAVNTSYRRQATVTRNERHIDIV